MSKAGNWFRKTGKKAKKGIEKTGSDIERTAKKAGREIEGTAKDAGREVENAAKKAEQLAKQAEGLSMSVIDDIKNLGKQIERTANKAKDEIEGTANKAKGEISQEVDKAGRFARQAEDFAKDLPGKADELIAEQLPKALEGLMQDIASEAMKPALKAAAKLTREIHTGLRKTREKHPDMMAEIDGLGVTIPVKLNVEIKLSYSEFYTRGEAVAGVLDRYANEGLKPRRRDIRGFLTATMATSIDFGGGAAITFGIDAGVKVMLNKISGRLFVLLVDTILEEMGVPE